MELEITHKVILTAFVLAMVLGAVVNKTNFCTMGAVSDWVNMGDTGRFRAWMFAIAIALIGVLAMEAAGAARFDSTFPPYRTGTFMWTRYILGGLMFGIGMTLGSGCGNKTIVRVGGGNLKSLVVLALIAFWAYLMTKTNFYGYVFHSWLAPISIDLPAWGIPSQELSTVLAGLLGAKSSPALHLGLGAAIALGLLAYVFRSRDFRTSLDNVLGGATVGAVIVIAWYVTAGSIGQEWKEFTEFMDNPPPGVAAQSFTFINPAGEALFWLMSPSQTQLITFGVAAVGGVICGSLLYSLATRRFHFEWFRTWKDFLNHALGGTLMGIGGVLSMGCTIGQGITGFSTLAVGSLLAFASIVLGSALTMKVQYYRMVYEQEASFAAALLSSLVDLRLLPKTLRRLEAV